MSTPEPSEEGKSEISPSSEGAEEVTGDGDLGEEQLESDAPMSVFLKKKTMADFPGLTTTTLRQPIFPPIPQLSLYGTTTRLTPGLSSEAILESVRKDYENATYKVESLTEREKEGTGKAVSYSNSSSTSPVPRLTPSPTPSMQSSPGMLTSRTLAASLAPVLSHIPPLPLPSTSSFTPPPPPSLLSERSLSIHTPQLKGASVQQLMSSYIQDLTMPLQVIDCQKFINWTDLVSTWTFEERKKREEKTSIARFANLGYYVPELDIEEDINSRIFLVSGDITSIACDVVINATNEALQAVSLVSQALMARAGPRLKTALSQLSMSAGESRMTKGYNLPATHVIHTAAPETEQPTLLKASLDSALTMAVENDFRTIAVPAFASESYPRPSSHPTYPLVPAVHVMMRTARKWMDTNWAKVDRLIFVASSPREFNVFCELMLDYFPCLPTKPPSPPPPPPPPPVIEEKPKSGKKKKKKKKKGKK
ncbi:putative MACRO domain-containing protein [Monocercomonoides exilis]|uniref:putative MACRO domain-containing protein n=1 Tax=Monocercomonoides exilis TaxID=2049356 RepID=UPI00355960C7|nr:putative MACRO domain-containing protein [Monocercomonoides exilis]|eukprot:MONOS_4788.1-p1 / transcript=MONOS_4788.1 / gene=MONOS_4788 / organism=Monocercomonoides_exilis_PA203 / gene_product=MACRO domain-containing protein / transcript_product=MACRO domain-containing protein / location=Mono_scaffold00132:47281-49040(+) / protein_length=480 / sequence_SO=supercontig / SO=protein_coding / is_pseudo=false